MPTKKSYAWLQDPDLQEFPVTPEEQRIVEQTELDPEPEDPENVSSTDPAPADEGKIVTGTEALSAYLGKDFTASDTPKEPAQMAVIMGQARTNPLNIRISPTEPKRYRLYFNTDFNFSPDLITRLSIFFRRRQADESVDIYLGCAFVNDFLYMLGAVVSAIESCRAHTTAHAVGLCGTPESLIWLSTNDRKISPYGGLIFGGYEGLKPMPEYQVYMENYTNKAKQLGVLTEEEVAWLIETKHGIMITYQDCIRKGIAQ